MTLLGYFNRELAISSATKKRAENPSHKIKKSIELVKNIITHLSATPMAEKGMTVALHWAARRTNSAFSGQKSLYSSPLTKKRNRSKALHISGSESTIRVQNTTTTTSSTVQVTTPRKADNNDTTQHKAVPVFQALKSQAKRCSIVLSGEVFNTQSISS